MSTLLDIHKAVRVFAEQRQTAIPASEVVHLMLVQATLEQNAILERIATSLEEYYVYPNVPIMLQEDPTHA